MVCKTEIGRVDDRVEPGESLETNAENLKDDRAVRNGARLLQQEEVVAFPTETVYGLGADARSPEAVSKIFQAKGRPQDNPLIVHIGYREQLNELISGEIPEAGSRLIAAFWPGPLTLVLPKNDIIPDATTAGLDSVGIRMPSHPVALALIRLSGLPVAAPSANSSGYPSPTRAGHVYSDLKGKIPYIIDGGPCPVGLESTVVDIRQKKAVILRPGGITSEDISRVLGYDVVQYRSETIDETPASPGMKYRHYSPAVPLKIVKTGDLRDKDLDEYKDLNPVFILSDETAADVELTDFPVIKMGKRKDLNQIAFRLFDILREADRPEYGLILIEELPEYGIGRAIMNRLQKAASR